MVFGWVGWRRRRRRRRTLTTPTPTLRAFRLLSPFLLPLSLSTPLTLQVDLVGVRDLQKRLPDRRLDGVLRAVLLAVEGDSDPVFFVLMCVFFIVWVLFKAFCGDVNLQSHININTISLTSPWSRRRCCGGHGAPRCCFESSSMIPDAAAAGRDAAAAAAAYPLNDRC